MAEKRRKFFHKATERRERLERIAASSPPPHTLEAERDTGDTFERIDDAENELDEEVAIVVAAQPAVTPAHRQPPPPQRTKVGEPPWWARAKPGEMTKTAEAERERMEQSKVAKSVMGRVNEV